MYAAALRSVLATACACKSIGAPKHKEAAEARRKLRYCNGRQLGDDTLLIALGTLEVARGAACQHCGLRVEGALVKIIKDGEVANVEVLKGHCIEYANAKLFQSVQYSLYDAIRQTQHDG